MGRPFYPSDDPDLSHVKIRIFFFFLRQSLCRSNFLRAQPISEVCNLTTYKMLNQIDAAVELNTARSYVSHDGVSVPKESQSGISGITAVDISDHCTFILQPPVPGNSSSSNDVKGL